MKKLLSILVISFLLFGFTSRQINGGTPIYAELDGASERPGPGDPDGSGWAVFRLNQGQGTISYELHVENIQTPTAAHIHIAPTTSPGPVVVPLAAPVNGVSMGTVDVDPELIKAIRKDPGNYYVNVHNATYPPGAIRGQLTK